MIAALGRTCVLSIVTHGAHTSESKIPLITKQQRVLNTIIRNPIWQYPPRIPSLGTSLQGPLLRNFAMPKAALNTDVQ